MVYNKQIFKKAFVLHSKDTHYKAMQIQILITLFSTEQTYSSIVLHVLFSNNS